MNAQYDHQPPKLEAVGNGSHKYRWNITQKNNSENDPIWECEEVIIWGQPERKKVTEAVICELWGVNEEAKLINDYNAANEGIIGIEYKQPYINFVMERKAVKEDILNFFEYEAI